MSLEITGRLIQKLDMMSGTSKTGNAWQKQEFVIETVEQYPKKICANLWGDRVDQLNQYNIGDMVKISFDLESREFNGRWYTDVRAWKIERVPMANGTMPQPNAYNPAAMQSPHTAYVPPAAPTAQTDQSAAAVASFPNSGMINTDTFPDNSTDDLPF